MQEERQQEIATENLSLMHRLANIMKEDRGDPMQKYFHFSVEFREGLRRKKTLKLQVSQPVRRRQKNKIGLRRPLISDCQRVCAIFRVRVLGFSLGEACVLTPSLLRTLYFARALQGIFQQYCVNRGQEDSYHF